MVVVRDPTPDEAEISSLLKAATAHAADQDYDSALQELRRAYTLMETVATEWPIDTYFRFARYLHLSGRYEAAVAWLQSLLDALDSRYDAREALYKQWGWGTRKTPAIVPKRVRNNVKRVIRNEMALYARRESKIQERRLRALSHAQ